MTTNIPAEELSRRENLWPELKAELRELNKMWQWGWLTTEDMARRKKEIMMRSDRMAKKFSKHIRGWEGEAYSGLEKQCRKNIYGY